MEDGVESPSDIALETETASDSAVRFLRALIFSGELGPDDKLPPERDLGARLGISRMTLRLALKALESTGYIVTTRGSRGGSRVADADSLSRCWNQWMHEHAGELDDIFEFRATIEAKLAALAAERRTDEDLQAMERAVGRRAATSGLVVALPHRHRHPPDHRPRRPQPPAGARHDDRPGRSVRPHPPRPAGEQAAPGARQPPWPSSRPSATGTPRRPPTAWRRTSAWSRLWWTRRWPPPASSGPGRASGSAAPARRASRPLSLHDAYCAAPEGVS